jgi:hypothetical protein
LAGEHVPGGDQDFARDGGLGRVLAGALGEIGVELVPGVGGSPRVLGGLDGGPAQGREPAFESAPVRERSPDWLIFGARPA